jgi:hypothetical protein
MSRRNPALGWSGACCVVPGGRLSGLGRCCTPSGGAAGRAAGAAAGAAGAGAAAPDGGVAEAALTGSLKSKKRL